MRNSFKVAEISKQATKIKWVLLDNKGFDISIRGCFQKCKNIGILCWEK